MIPRALRHGGPAVRLEGAATPVQLDIRPDWRQTLTSVAGIVSVLLVAAGLFYTNEANRKQQEANRAQQALAERGQVTERFSRAIDQLGQEGADKLSIRLGGMYALEQLMRDSPGDEPAIIEVLCAFVRTHAPTWTPDGPTGSLTPNSPMDVRTAVIVLARRPSPGKFSDIDLSGTALGLPGVKLLGASLPRVALVGANLSFASLAKSDLSRARLPLADLDWADLSFAHLPGVNLSGANLREADLTGADLAGADLDLADFYSANLSGADLSGADMTNARLEKANLSRANLSQVELLGADLQSATGVTTESMRCAKVAAGTKLPPGVTGRSAESVENDPTCR